jgi:ADP-ribose pyrophosphatase YjhB (NUDIX family)
MEALETMLKGPLYAEYDWQAAPVQSDYVYCPRCAAPLETRPVAGLPRPVCPGCGFIHFLNPAPAVAVLVVQGGSVLLGLRAGEPGAGKWASPSGYVEYNDDYLSTARRELLEETGLEIEILSILRVESAFLAPQAHYLAVYLLARPSGGELRPGDDLLEARWFPLSGPLPEMAFEPDRAAIERLAAWAADPEASSKYPGLPLDEL